MTQKHVLVEALVEALEVARDMKPSRETSLAITKLQEAAFWAGLIAEEEAPLDEPK
jgi:hypothetical protein